jgi:hypothetical protein
MKAIYQALAFKLAIGTALAQGATDPVAHLRACSVMERAARIECMEKLSRDIVPADRPKSATDNWVVSETTSPVNYAPIVVATTVSRGGTEGAPVQLAIHCRSGRTELVISGPEVLAGGPSHALSYSVNDGQPVQVAAGPPQYGAGIAFAGDVVRLLQSLPEEGQVTVRILRADRNQSSSFALGGLKTVREKLAVACKWPQAVARPSN